MGRSFDGLRVLDLTHVLAGPYASYLLALQGADVVKIEQPNAPDAVRGRGNDRGLNAAQMGVNYLSQAANKRSLTLDLQKAEGQAILQRLARDADVLIENYRTGALSELGVGYEALSAINPHLVYCSITGFGQSGPRAAVNAYDNVIQAASGLMDFSGTAETGPLKSGASFVDYATGLTAAFAIASALHRRAQDDRRRGVHIDCAMLDVALSLIGAGVTNAINLPVEPAGQARESGLDCYRTADGLLMLGAFNARQHRRLWNDFGRPDFAALSSWDDMAIHADAMRAELAERLVKRPAAEWEAHFHMLGIPAERVRSVSEAVNIVESQARGFLQPMDIATSDGVRRLRVPAAAFAFSEDGPTIERAAPEMGADNHAILAGIGYDAAGIAALRARGIVQ